MGDLSGGRDPGIGPPGSLHGGDLGTGCGEGRFEGILDRAATGLALPTGEGTTVVGEVEPETAGCWGRGLHGMRGGYLSAISRLGVAKSVRVSSIAAC